LEVRVQDYSKVPDLYDAISRYYVLLSLASQASSAYKTFESETGTLRMSFVTPGGQKQAQSRPTGSVSAARVEARCNSCGTKEKGQVDFERGEALESGAVRLPRGGIIPCQRCQKALDLRHALAQIERESGRQAVYPDEPTP